MTEGPKRRGRPPGAKNKTPTQRAIELTGIPYLEPAAIESYTTGPASVRVIVRFKVAFGAPGDEHEVDWPQGWPIPQLNDAIKVGGKSGRVQFVTYDYDDQVIRVSAT